MSVNDSFHSYTKLLRKLIKFRNPQPNSEHTDNILSAVSPSLMYTDGSKVVKFSDFPQKLEWQVKPIISFKMFSKLR